MHIFKESKSSDKVRLDKWLWAARFYKTRALASAAVNGGKVHLSGQRVKPSRLVKMNDLYEVHRGFDKFMVRVTALSDKRGSATVAQMLYEETEESVLNRQKAAEQRKIEALSRPVSSRKPSKRDRRKIISFTGK